MKPKQPKNQFCLEVKSLEVAKGFDGFFRGAPEPVLVCGVYAISDSHSELLGRGILRFPNLRTFPTTLKMSDSVLVQATQPKNDERQLAVILMALEEDGGKDIQRAYAMLQAHTELLLLETSGEPIAVDIQEMIHDVAHWGTARRIELVVDHEHFDRSCDSDKWISASGFVVQRGERSRVHFVSLDRKNDWTALVAIH